jgi:hypothetical protein
MWNSILSSRSMVSRDFPCSPLQEVLGEDQQEGFQAPFLALVRAFLLSFYILNFILIFLSEQCIPPFSPPGESANAVPPLFF